VCLIVSPVSRPQAIQIGDYDEDDHRGGCVSVERGPRAAGDGRSPPGEEPLGVTRTQRYGLLMLLVLTDFVVLGVSTPQRWEQVVLSILLGATVILSLWVAEARPKVIRPVAAVVIALVLFSIIEASQGNVDSAATRVASALLVILAPPAVVIGVARGLRRHKEVTLQTVFGVLCVFVLLGMFFAAVYGSMEGISHEPFFAEGEAATAPRTMYFSFTTLTTVGYGDLTARSNLGHTLAVSEALLGQIYLVTVVALIVSNLRGRRVFSS
jgi:hypothetical protein